MHRQIPNNYYIYYIRLNCHSTSPLQSLIWISTCLCVNIHICESAWLPTLMCQHIWVSTCLYVNLHIFQPTWLSTCFCVDLYGFQPAYVSHYSRVNLLVHKHTKVSTCSTVLLYQPAWGVGVNLLTCGLIGD